MYNYYESVQDDIRTALDNGGYDYLLIDSDDFDEFAERLQDELFTDDGITGNGSGSYTFNTAEAMEYVMDNKDLLNEVMEYGYLDRETVADWFINDEWESMDVTIRCYILDECLSDVLDDMGGEDAFNEWKENA